MIVVHEIWELRPEFTGSATRILQEMDDLLGSNAHEHPGWSGHATFYQNAARPAEVILSYPWASIESHRDLSESEENILSGFTGKYFTGERRIEYYETLAVEVEGDEH
jgi:3-oxoacyl-[acyl-carrier protein] reductase